jgi:hypothetical protein
VSSWVASAVRLDVPATANRLSATFVPANGYTFTDTFDIERK